MHVTDTLAAGGAERVAVDLANLLPRDRYQVHLCTTRRDGPLAAAVAAHVRRLSLGRRSRCDAAALRRLAAHITAHDIRIIHAHGTALFVAAVATMMLPGRVVLWHDHYGLHGVQRRPTWFYRLALRRASGVLAVTRALVEWAHCSLGFPRDRVWYVPNFVREAAQPASPPDLPGGQGMRILCVANLRRQKDHLTLIRAMAHVVQRAPHAHLLLAGEETDAAYRAAVRAEIAMHRLQDKVSLLGRRDDVSALLAACDIGVLGSASEGFPLALIEYGAAGLPAVATRVGECAEILEDGRAGVLVPPSAPGLLAEALLALLHSPAERARLGQRLQLRVREQYSPAAAVTRICDVYDTLLETNRAAAPAVNGAGDALG